MGEKAKYYFTVRSKLETEPKTVQDIINSNKSNSYAFGSEGIETPGKYQMLDAVVTSGVPEAVFIEGYILYLVVIDEYNNVSNIDKMEIQPLKSE